MWDNYVAYILISYLDITLQILIHLKYILAIKLSYISSYKALFPQQDHYTGQNSKNGRDNLALLTSLQYM